MTVVAVRQGTEEWLDARRAGIGSSDAAIIAGEKGSVVALWGEKTGLAPRPEPGPELEERYAWGHRLEPLVAEAYTEQTGRPLRRAMRMLRHPDVAWAQASLDRVSARKGERRIVELKVSSLDAKYAGDELPGDVLAQVQHQLWVTGYEVADVAVLMRHWNLAVFEVERDTSYIDDLVFLETEFWRWVESRTLPPMDGSESARRVLASLFRRNNGYLLPRSGALDDMAAQLYDAKAELAKAKDTLGTVENAIRAVIGDADGFEGDWGRITWRKNRDSERVDWKGLATVYERTVESLVRELRQHVPTLELEGSDVTTDQGLGNLLAAARSLYTETKEGPRVLRPTWKGQPAQEEAPNDSAD